MSRARTRMLRGLLGVGREAVGVQEMGREDLHDLVLVPAPCPFDVVRGGEMSRPPVSLGECLVGHLLHEGLEEPILPAFGGARIHLKSEELLANERGERGFQLFLASARERGDPCSGEGLAEDGGVLEQGSLLGRDAVEPGCDEGLECLGNGEILDRSGGFEPVALSLHEAPVQEHPDGFDRVERNAFGTIADPVAKFLGEPRDHPDEELVHRVVHERLEREGGRAVPSRAPRGPALEQLRSGEAHDEQRMVA